MVSLAYPCIAEGGNFLVQMFSTCHRGLRGRGEGIGTLWIGEGEIGEGWFEGIILCLILSEKDL